mmetsp:Transcript_40274/g.96071  ORF Transcript_40274/g.96071 Transcript_40274/m.96071 type:complete len:173 (+) Transcript_40274:2-520(+)
MKSDDMQVQTPLKVPPTPKPPALPDTSWMRMVEARRQHTEAWLGPKADHPKPRTKLRGSTPKRRAESQDWGYEARDLDQKVLARLLLDLKERLAKERLLTSAAEAKLRRTESECRFDGLSSAAKAKSLSKAQACGWYHNNAAGVENLEPPPRPRKEPPRAACPYATADGPGC